MDFSLVQRLPSARVRRASFAHLISPGQSSAVCTSVTGDTDQHFNAQCLLIQDLKAMSSGTYVIGGTDEIQMVLDDQIVKIQSMHASPFVKAFKDRVIDWEHTLQTLQVGPSEAWMDGSSGRKKT
eukprot:1160450-Pelagomonas_calceolata.AAC.7